MISKILRKLASFLSFYYKNSSLDPIKNQRIVDQINIKLKKIKIFNLKKTHVDFNLQVYNLLKKKRLKDF